MVKNVGGRKPAKVTTLLFVFHFRISCLITVLEQFNDIVA